MNVRIEAEKNSCYDSREKHMIACLVMKTPYSVADLRRDTKYCDKKW